MGKGNRWKVNENGRFVPCAIDEATTVKPKKKAIRSTGHVNFDRFSCRLAERRQRLRQRSGVSPRTAKVIGSLCGCPATPGSVSRTDGGELGGTPLVKWWRRRGREAEGDGEKKRHSPGVCRSRSRLLGGGEGEKRLVQRNEKSSRAFHPRGVEGGGGPVRHRQEYVRSGRLGLLWAALTH